MDYDENGAVIVPPQKQDVTVPLFDDYLWMRICAFEDSVVVIEPSDPGHPEGSTNYSRYDLSEAKAIHAALGEAIAHLEREAL